MKPKKPKEKKIKPIKVKKPKKKMPKEIASTALLWIIAAICLGVAIPLHFRFPSFSWKWMVFVAVFVISPFALLNFKCYVESKNHFTQEQIQNANVQFSKMVFSIWFWDCVFMVFINHWKIASYILGAIGVIKVFYSLAINFVGRNKKETFFDLSMIFDFLAGTALAVYLIYLIPDPTVQTIVTTIVAAMFGGLLTLVGVAWTIRRQDTIRQEEEKKKYKPLVFIRNPQLMTKEDSQNAIFFYMDSQTPIFTTDHFQFDDKKKKNHYFIKQFYLYNTEVSYCSFKGFLINDEILSMEIGQVFAKNKLYRIYFNRKFAFDQPIQSVSLLLEDMLENFYSLELNFETEEQDNQTDIIIKSGIELKETNIHYYQEDTP